MSANLSVARVPLWNTQNDLPERVRVEAIALLNEHLGLSLILAVLGGSSARDSAVTPWQHAGWRGLRP